jgi:hypothetical protein
VLTYITFTFVGALSGAIIAFSLDMKTPKEMIQGATRSRKAKILTTGIY